MFGVSRVMGEATRKTRGQPNERSQLMRVLTREREEVAPRFRHSLLNGWLSPFRCLSSCLNSLLVKSTNFEFEASYVQRGLGARCCWRMERQALATDSYSDSSALSRRTSMRSLSLQKPQSLFEWLEGIGTTLCKYYFCDYWLFLWLCLHQFMIYPNN